MDRYFALRGDQSGRPYDAFLRGHGQEVKESVRMLFVFARDQGWRKVLVGRVERHRALQHED